MGTKEKLIERFKSLPANFIFGYEKSNKGKTSGSRVIFKNGDKRPIMIHKPHPGNLIKGYAMKQVLNDLMDAGFIK